MDRASRRTVAWVVGDRDAATFQRLYHKVKHLTDCIFYTDDWEAFAHVLPPERHVIGKAHTIMIEQDNSNTRHHLGRMTRRTKVVSKKEEMVYAAIKLWCALTQPETFAEFQKSALSIFG
ncbi:MAG: IS1 family transposase [Gammaproteobacteria bacterium]